MELSGILQNYGKMWEDFSQRFQKVKEVKVSVITINSRENNLFR